MKKNVGAYIIVIFLAILALGFAALSIGASFGLDFAVNLEYFLIKEAGWEKFNLLVTSLLILIGLNIIICVILVTADNKTKKVENRTRRQTTMFK